MTVVVGLAVVLVGWVLFWRYHPTTCVLIPTGLEYCTVHSGLADCNQDRCDFASHDDLPCELFPLVYDEAAPSRLVGA